MQPRTLDQIYSSIGNLYDPQVNSIRAQQAAIPGELQADEQQLGAKQSQAFDDITSSAQKRGMFFSGFPLAEQARYSSTEYMPALANLRSAQKAKATSLEDMINQINERRAGNAQSIFTDERDFYEKQRQFNEQMAASRASGGGGGGGGYDPSYGGGAGGAAQGPVSHSASAVQRADKGFNYFDAQGRPISAAAYAAAKGVNFRDVLAQAAKAGDKGSATALNFVGNDLGYDNAKLTSPALASLYNALVWGTGRSATYTPRDNRPVGLSVLKNPNAPYQAPSGSSVLNLIKK